MALPQCICITDVGPTNIGAATIIRYKRELWLITAAHVPNKSQDFQQDIRSLPDEILLWIPGKKAPKGKRIRLFDEDPARTPRFRYHRANGIFSDVICLPLAEVARTKGVRRHELIYSLDNLPLGNSLETFGFPDLNPQTAYPESKVQMELVADNGGSLRTSKEFRQGYSGGPALANGTFIGIAIGSTDGLGTVISSRLIAQIIDGRA
ncbi:hypothetical protein [Paenirhodobacter enshiensis]|uniref:hypothetical protein n=1 Tax=Paenirhodobacter enshiensis TaxID=1105367 RepID=UPI0012685359|nr:hypothetical protein [Paenirhodobacter enshiensis]